MDEELDENVHSKEKMINGGFIKTASSSGTQNQQDKKSNINQNISDLRNKNDSNYNSNNNNNNSSQQPQRIQNNYQHSSFQQPTSKSPLKNSIKSSNQFIQPGGTPKHVQLQSQQFIQPSIKFPNASPSTHNNTNSTQFNSNQIESQRIINANINNAQQRQSPGFYSQQNADQRGATKGYRSPPLMNYQANKSKSYNSNLQNPLQNQAINQVQNEYFIYDQKNNGGQNDFSATPPQNRSPYGAQSHTEFSPPPSRLDNIKVAAQQQTSTPQYQSSKAININNDRNRINIANQPQQAQSNKQQQNIDDQILNGESKVMRILRAKMSVASGITQNEKSTTQNKKVNSAAQQPKQQTATPSNIQRKEQKFINSNSNQQPISNNDLQIYRDGKVVALGGGAAIYNTSQKQGHRLVEEKSISNMNAHHLLSNKTQRKNYLTSNQLNINTSGSSIQDVQSNSNNQQYQKGAFNNNKTGSGTNVDQFVQRQQIDDARRKQKIEQAQQEQKNREEREYQEFLQHSQQFKSNQSHGRNQSQQSLDNYSVKPHSFENFYQQQLEFQARVEKKINHYKEDQELKMQQQSAQSAPKLCIGSKRILQKYKRKDDQLQTDEGESPIADEDQKDKVSQAYDRLYHNRSLIPIIENRKQKQQQDELESHKNQVKKNLKDQQEYMEKLYSIGGTAGKDDSSVGGLKKSSSKWSNLSTFQPELATSKSKTDKMIFDRLRKEFHEFFKLDLYYASVCYASKKAYDHIDDSIIQKATNLLGAAAVVKSEDEKSVGAKQQYGLINHKSSGQRNISNILYSAHQHTQSVKTLKEIISKGDEDQASKQKNGKPIRKSVLKMQSVRDMQGTQSVSSDRSQGGVQKHTFRMHYERKINNQDKSIDQSQTSNELGPSSSQLQKQKQDEEILRANLLKGTPIRYPQYMQVMHSLGFLAELQASTAIEEQNLAEIWKMLGGNKPGMGRTVKAENLFVLLCALLNIKLSVLVQKDHDEEKLPEGHRFEGFLCFDQYENAHFISYEDITKIHKKFKQLAMNRFSRKADNSLQQQRFTKEELLNLKSYGSTQKTERNFQTSNGSQKWLANSSRTRSHSYSQRNFKLGIDQEGRGVKGEKIEYVTIDGEQVTLNEIKERFKVRADVSNHQPRAHNSSNSLINNQSILNQTSRGAGRLESNKSLSQFSQLQKSNVEPQGYTGKRIETYLITAVQREDEGFHEAADVYRDQTPNTRSPLKTESKGSSQNTYLLSPNASSSQKSKLVNLKDKNQNTESKQTSQRIAELTSNLNSHQVDQQTTGSKYSSMISGSHGVKGGQISKFQQPKQLEEEMGLQLSAVMDNTNNNFYYEDSNLDISQAEYN